MVAWKPLPFGVALSRTSIATPPSRQPCRKGQRILFDLADIRHRARAGTVPRAVNKRALRNGRGLSAPPRRVQMNVTSLATML
jgi:hypothetical protein